jgi:hypothetical protein
MAEVCEPFSAWLGERVGTFRYAGTTLAGSLLFASPKDEPSDHQHGSTPHKEPSIPIDPLLLRRPLVDMMNSEELVVNEAFNYVENAEAHQHRPGQHLARPPEMRFVSIPPHQDQAQSYKDVGAGVKKAIPKCVELQCCRRVSRIHTAQHMMPLQDLMQHDSIEEATQAQPQQKSG